MSVAAAFDSIAIVGATGPTGFELARQLLAEGETVRVVSRNIDSLTRMFPEARIEKRAGDALSRESMLHAIEGCDLVVDCIGLPSAQMADHVPLAKNLAAVLKTSGARCLQVSSYWCYIPLEHLPVSEHSPRRGGPPWARYRREAEDILCDAGAAIVHLPDFFGPHVHTSTLQLPLKDALAGKPMNWIGAPDVPREYIFVPDAMNAVVELLKQPQAYGEHWVIPGSGPVTANEIARMLSEILGRNVRVRSAGPLMLRLISLFQPELRGFLQMVPTYVAPVRYDGSKLENLLGTVPRTPYAKALAQTVRVMQAEHSRA